MTETKRVTIYTDGACIGNPGPGGYGAVLLYNEHRKELSGGYRETTNNRMEIMAAIVGLRALKAPCEVTLYSDSQYLVNAMMKGWAKKWRAFGWMRNKNKDPAINPDLWAQMLELCDTHVVEFKWVRGHSGNKENERCDFLSVQAAKRGNLPADAEYERARRERFVAQAYESKRPYESNGPPHGSQKPDESKRPHGSQTPRGSKRRHGSKKRRKQ